MKRSSFISDRTREQRLAPINKFDAQEEPMLLAWQRNQSSLTERQRIALLLKFV